MSAPRVFLTPLDKEMSGDRRTAFPSASLHVYVHVFMICIQRWFLPPGLHFDRYSSPNHMQIIQIIFSVTNPDSLLLGQLPSDGIIQEDISSFTYCVTMILYFQRYLMTNSYVFYEFMRPHSFTGLYLTQHFLV